MGKLLTHQKKSVSMDARFPPTSNVPLDSEAYISNSEADPAVLNARLAAAQTTLDEPLNQRMELTAKIASYRIGIAPHKKLPPELLSDIFRYCVPGPVSLPQQLHAVPVLLCQICSTWRTVALETPMLWNAIEVDFGKVQGDPQAVRLLAVAKTWIARSGMSTPLSIQIHIDQCTQISLNMARLNPIDDLIIAYINRLHKINLLMCPSFFEPLCRLPGGSAKLLKDLSLGTLDDTLSWSAALEYENLLDAAFTSTSSIFPGP